MSSRLSNYAESTPQELGALQLASFVNPAGMDHSLTGYLVASISALVVSFALTYFFGFSDTDLESERSVKKVRLGKREPAGA